MAPNQEFDTTVYAGTYSNVPVYELRLGDNMVFRRRSDNYINATHILKVADLDKPARTRVLEKEVQLGIHEKVQGGYGKYQGTWIPLESGVDLAKKYAVYHLLQTLFEFVPGAQSPPPAPKHTTASSNRTKAPRASAAQRVAAAAQQRAQQQQQINSQHASQPHNSHLHSSQPTMAHENSYEYGERHINLPREEESFDNTTVASMMDDDEYDAPGSRSRGTKRKRDPKLDDADRDTSPTEFWADALLDYYVVSGSDPSHQAEFAPPPPPSGIDINACIDNEGHTALHWAAAMGDLEFVKDLMARGASIDVINDRGETPLIKCSGFTNCYDRGTYQAMVRQLSKSITHSDNSGATILHQITRSTLGTYKGNRARYYLDVAMDQLESLMPQAQFFEFCNRRDHNGDTAFHIAVRASRRCVRVFQSKGIPVDVPNQFGETVEQMLRDKDERAAMRRKHIRGFQPYGPWSSSPAGPNSPYYDPNDTKPRWMREREREQREQAEAAEVHFAFTQRSGSKSSEQFKQAMTTMAATAANKFMEDGEMESAVKDAYLADIRAATNRIRAQIAAAQQLRETLENEPVEDVGQLSEERAQLARDAEAYSEQMQHRYLHHAIREGEARARSRHDRMHGGAGGDATGAGGVVVDDKEIAERIKIAIALHYFQEARKKRTVALVEAQAEAGMDETGEQALRVLMKTLNTTKEKTVAMIPDLLAEMELAKKPEVPDSLIDPNLE